MTSNEWNPATLHRWVLKTVIASLGLAAWAAQPAVAWAQGSDAPPAQLDPVYTPPPPAARELTPSVAADTYGEEQSYSASRVGRVSGFMGWSFNTPLGSVRDFTSVVSPLGFELQFNGWVTPNISLGVSGEWVTFVDNRPRTTISVDEAAITATAYNATQTTSARFLIHYAFLGDAPVQPYIGPHVGVSWSSFDSEAADLILSDTQFSVNFGGEAGVQVPFGRNAPVALLNLRYSISPSAEFRNTVSNVQSLGLMLGLGF